MEERAAVQSMATRIRVPVKLVIQGRTVRKVHNYMFSFGHLTTSVIYGLRIRMVQKRSLTDNNNVEFVNWIIYKVDQVQ